MNQAKTINLKEIYLKILFWSVSIYLFVWNISPILTMNSASLKSNIFKISLFSSVTFFFLLVIKYGKFNRFGVFPFFIIFFFTIYSLRIIYTGNFTEIDIKAALTIYNRVYAYIVPFIILVAISFNNWIYISKTILRMTIFFSLLIPLAFLYSRDEFGKSLENILVILVGFSLLISRNYIVGNKKKIIIAAFWILLFLVAVLWGRRGRTLSLIYYYIASAIILIRFGHLSKQWKVFYKISTLIIFIIVIFIVFTFQEQIYVLQRGFDNQAYEGSRGLVFESFFQDFRSFDDYVFGRGLGANVYRGMDKQEFANSVENGWLTLLLQGGLIYVTPILIIFLRVIYLGFFKSSNVFSKILSTIVMINILDMLASDFAGLTVSYILVWMATGSLLSKEFRNYPEEYFIKAFRSKL